MVEIRDVRPDDYQDWVQLWNAYLEFYNVKLDTAVTEHAWASIINPNSLRSMRVAVKSDHMIAFAIYHFYSSTWALGTTCYLEDLYLDASERGQGIGRTMMDDFIALARAKQCSQVFWHTRHDNKIARSLYDQYVHEDGNVRYTLNL